MGLSRFINQDYKCFIQSVWITAAWQSVSPKVIVKCCVSSGMDGTGDRLWSGREEDGNPKS